MKKLIVINDYAMLRYLLASLMILLNLCAFSQKPVTIQGNIMDAFLECGLDSCEITLLREDSSEVKTDVNTFQINGQNKIQTTIFYLKEVPNVAGNYLIHVQREGYSDGWGKVTIPENYRGGTIKGPVIGIRKAMATVHLGEVEVKATRIKVKMRGDTLVYDASAFNLPQGSMLSNLIEQLPGARMTEEGEIFINGRKIDELTLNSKSLFKGSKKVLLENLPYFTVKELKVFERPHVEKVMRKEHDDNPEYVMDVNLKNQYSTSTMANADAGGGTNDRYILRGFGLVNTPTLTVGAFANVNNINDSYRLGGSSWNNGSGFYVGNGNKPSTRRGVGMSINYQSQKKSHLNYPAVTSSSDLFYDDYDNRDESHVYREHFLPQGITFSQSHSNAFGKVRLAQFVQNFNYIPWEIHVNFMVYYKHNREGSSGEVSQWDSLSTTATQQTLMTRKTKEYGLGWFRLNYAIPGIKNLYGTFSTRWTRQERDAFNRQQSTLRGQPDSYRHEQETLSKTDYYVVPSLSYNIKFSETFRVNLSERFSHSDTHTNDPLYLLNDSNRLPSMQEQLLRTFDADNSTFSHLLQQENEATIAVSIGRERTMENFQQRPFSLTLSLPFFYQYEHLDYQRGAIDTLGRHRMFVVNPSLRVRCKEWTGWFGMSTSSPGMMNLMPYRDTRNPLSISEGNPALKNNRSLQASIDWNFHPKQDKDGKRTTSNSYAAGSSFKYHLRSVAQGATYDPVTSAYTYRPENVKGNWSWNTHYNMSLSLHKNQMWWLDNETSSDVIHSVDYINEWPSQQSHDVSSLSTLHSSLNKVETVNLRDQLTLRYTGKNTKVRLLGELRWRRTWGHRESSPSISAYDYRYGVIAQQIIPAWNTSINVDATMNSRRGYSTSAMNKDEMIVKASITQTVMKGKLKFTLEAHDLFNQFSNKTYEVNAQGRTESWYRVTPHYVMLRVGYNFYVGAKR